MKKKFTLFFLLLCSIAVFSQKKDFKPIIISFYNLENFYDTINNTMVNDEEFLPDGPRNYTTAVYF